MGRARNPRHMRVVRHARVRHKVQGDSGRPRLALFRSLSHIYVQVIDDSTGRTLVAASSGEADVKAQATGTKTARSGQVGTLVAKRAKEKGIRQVVFDSGGFKYHGRVKALADAARKEGLQF